MAKKLTSLNHSSDDSDPISPTAEGSKMENLEELVKQQLELEEKIKAIREAKKQEKIASMLSEMKIYGITLEDLMDAEDQPKRRRRNTSSDAKTSTAKVKYHDSAGNTWSGRGLTPRWIKDSGRPKEDFKIKD